MTDHSNIISAPLVYNGEVISHRDDMLSLTDMWKAAGSPEGRRPTDWKNDSGHVEFLEHVANVLNTAVGGIWKGTRGKGGATFGHWQIGLAYAKYLSPEFHMWCNQVVRERMEGKSLAVANMSPELLEMLRRDDGMIKMLAHKVTEMEKMMPALAMQAIDTAITARLAEHNFMIRRGKTAKEIWDGHHLPAKLRGATTWLGNRLAEMGGCIDNEGRFDRGSIAVRLFDPDKAAMFMKNGLLLQAKTYASERMGQKTLRLVGKAPS